MLARGEPAARQGLTRRTALVLLLCAAILSWSGPDQARGQAAQQTLASRVQPPALPEDGLAPLTLGQRQPDPSLGEFDQAEQEFEEYDPWEPFNEKTFKFNYELDKRAIKPVAKGYDKVVPNFVERAIANVFENIGSLRRIVNLAIQGRFNDSGHEFGRFFINTFFGLAGFVDAAPSFGVGKVDADTGQTLGLFGVGPGPFLMVPLFPPLTVRDAVGLVLDAAMDPTTWLVPFEFGFSASAVRRINERALSLELFENVEETTFDLYGAVRNAYLQQRRALVRQALTASPWHRKRKPMDKDEPPAAPRTPPAEPSPTPREDKASDAATARTETGHGEEGLLVVDASPNDAEISLDGRALGSARTLFARALTLASGQHTVTIVAEGFTPYVGRFLEDPGSLVHIRAALEPRNAGDGAERTRVTRLSSGVSSP